MQSEIMSEVISESPDEEPVGTLFDRENLVRDSQPRYISSVLISVGYSLTTLYLTTSHSNVSTMNFAALLLQLWQLYSHL